MYGLFQTSFYFGYMAVFSTALGIMCGEFQIFWQFSNRFFSDSYFWLELVVLECICLQDLLKKSLRRIPRVFCLYLVPTLYRRFLWIVSSDRKIIFVLCREFHPLCNLEKSVFGKKYCKINSIFYSTPKAETTLAFCFGFFTSPKTGSTHWGINDSTVLMTVLCVSCGMYVWGWAEQRTESLRITFEK